MKSLKTNWMFVAIMGGLCLLAGFGPARADLIPVLDPPTVTNNGNGTFTYTYRADLTADQKLRAGDFLTLYDFQGYVPNSAFVSTSGYAIDDTHLLGPNPPNVTPTDDPAVVNLSVKRTDPSTVLGPTASAFVFGAKSTLPLGPGTSPFASLATKNEPNNQADNTPVSNVGSVSAPGGAAVPEPASLVLVGLGLPLALPLLRKRHRAVAA